MKKIKNYTIFLLIAFLFIPFLFSFAQDPLVETGDDIIAIFNNILSWLWRLFAIATVIAFLVAGFYYLTSAGDPNKVDKATNMVKYGVIGVVVALLSAAVVSIIESFLTP